RGSGTDEGTGSKPGVLDVPSDDLEEELSWNSFDDEDEEEESFDPIPRTPKESEEESNDEEHQELRLSEEARIQEEEDADELYLHQYMTQQMTEAVREAVQIQTDRLQDMKKIIKGKRIQLKRDKSEQNMIKTRQKQEAW
nr:hypothetical protein [Tanacetum cinerariifolium]